jgi:hypothetical protein
LHSAQLRYNAGPSGYKMGAPFISALMLTPCAETGRVKFKAGLKITG